MFLSFTFISLAEEFLEALRRLFAVFALENSSNIEACVVESCCATQLLSIEVFNEFLECRSDLALLKRLLLGLNGCNCLRLRLCAANFLRDSPTLANLPKEGTRRKRLLLVRCECSHGVHSVGYVVVTGSRLTPDGGLPGRL